MCGLAKRRGCMQLEGRWCGVWNVVVWCAHVDVAVVAYDQGLIGIPLAGPRSKIVPGPCTTVGRLHPLTRGLLVVSLLHISCG